MAIKIKRIEQEFTFKTLLTSSTKLKIYSHKKEFNCKILKYTEEFLEIAALEHDVSFLKKGDEIRAFFLFQNNRHTFETRILEVKPGSVIIKQPDGLYKDLQREYERIKADQDFKINFKLKEKRIELNFPKTESYAPVRDNAVPGNLNYKNMELLIKDFAKNMQPRVSEHKIIMLRNKMPATYEELVMAKTGKILWFPVIEKGLVADRLMPGNILFTQKDFFQYEEQNGLSAAESKEKLVKILAEKIGKGVYSQLYCPVLYNEYFIGYIYLANMIDKRDSIDLEMTKYVMEFSRILCYSLKVNDYFQARKPEDANFEVPIIDISASGLLFAHPEKRLPGELLLHTPLDITLTIQNRKLNIGALIMRKYRDTRYCYFGIRFQEIAPEDFRFLYEYIYGKEYIQTLESVQKELARELNSRE